MMYSMVSYSPRYCVPDGGESGTFDFPYITSKQKKLVQHEIMKIERNMENIALFFKEQHFPEDLKCDILHGIEKINIDKLRILIEKEFDALIDKQVSNFFGLATSLSVNLKTLLENGNHKYFNVQLPAAYIDRYFDDEDTKREAQIALGGLKMFSARFLALMEDEESKFESRKPGRPKYLTEAKQRKADFTGRLADSFKAYGLDVKKSNSSSNLFALVLRKCFEAMGYAQDDVKSYILNVEQYIENAYQNKVIEIH